MRHVPLVVLIVLFLVSGPATAEEKVALVWQVEPGDRYEVVKTNITKTVTVTEVAGEEERETELEKTVVVHGLQVLAVKENGNLVMRFSTESGVIDKTGGEQGHKLTMKRDENGDPLVEVEVPGLGPQATATRKVMESLGGDLLNLAVEFEMTPQGTIVSSEIKGSLFENLPTDDEVMAMVGKLPKEELAGAATADGFPILPEESVAVGGTWPVERRIDVMGLTLDGSGTGRLVGIQDGQAVLEESQRYEVDASGLGTRMERMMGVLFGQSGLPIQVQVSFDPVEPIEVKARSRFDLGDGFVVRTIWETMKVELAGVMEISVLGETSNATLSVATEADVKLEWKRLR